MKIKKVVAFLNDLFPISNQEVWDFSGPIHQILAFQENQLENTIIGLDLTTNLIDIAIENNCNFIITHHPFIFNSSIIHDFYNNPYKIEIFKKIVKHRIFVFSLHTNYDKSHSGMIEGYKTLYKLPFEIEKMTNLEYGFKSLSKFSYSEIKTLILEKMNFEILDSNFNLLKNENQKLNLIFFPGSIDNQSLIILSKCQDSLIVTSDLKWSQWILANELNLKVISISHEVEKGFSYHLKNILKKEFGTQKILNYFSIRKSNLET